MPNGTSAPGKVFPPPLVQVLVSTSWAGLDTAVLRVLWFVAPAGRWVDTVGLAHAAFPVDVLAQGADIERAAAAVDVLGVLEGVRVPAAAGVAANAPPMRAIPAANARAAGRR
jgi:hypothetical protein